jgi:hypothetical protein
MQVLRGLALVGLLVSTFIVGELLVRSSTKGRKGSSAGLTGVVKTRSCRYRSVELVYPVRRCSFLVPLAYGS